MKKYAALAAALVLTLSVFTGCGCRKQVPETLPPTESTLLPTVMPTEPSTAATENATRATENTTASTEHDVIPDGTDQGAADTTNPGSVGDSTTATGENNARSRAPRVQ